MRFRLLEQLANHCQDGGLLDDCLAGFRATRHADLDDEELYGRTCALCALGSAQERLAGPGSGTDLFWTALWITKETRSELFQGGQYELMLDLPARGAVCPSAVAVVEAVDAGQRWMLISTRRSERRDDGCCPCEI